MGKKRIQIFADDETLRRVELAAQIRELQEVILQERDGQPVDVDAILEELREERDEEALSLR